MSALRTTEKLINAVKARASDEKLDGSKVRDVLKEEMIKILSVPPRVPRRALLPRRK